jgi:hypothetical protein
MRTIVLKGSHSLFCFSLMFLIRIRTDHGWANVGTEHLRFRPNRRGLGDRHYTGSGP